MRSARSGLDESAAVTGENDASQKLAEKPNLFPVIRNQAESDFFARNALLFLPKEDVESFLLTHSTRPHVRKALFDRVMNIAQSNPGINSDDVLDELEQLDLERKAKQQPAKHG